MTELDILKHAKSYLDQLTQGIDPISGNHMKEDETLNQERLSKCFTYISAVLDKVIENGGEVTATVEHKTKFSATEEQLARVPLSHTPIAISVFCQKIYDALNDPTMKKPSANKITAWLEEKDFLVSQTLPNGKQSKFPTEEGSKIGITNELRTGQYGDYYQNLYSKEAQELLIEYLPEIL